MAIKILLVEDDELMATQIEVMCDKLGFHSLKRVTTYEKALAYLHINKVDLIILDIQLASLKTGLDLAEKIKYWLIPIVFITSNNNEELYKRSLDLPLSGFIVKPFHLYTLDSVIRSLLSLERINQYIVLDGQVNKAENIIYLEVDNTYTYINIEGGKKLVVKKSLTKILQDLPDNLFLQIHRRYAINKGFIDKIHIQKGIVEVKGGLELPISRRMAHEFRRSIHITND